VTATTSQQRDLFSKRWRNIRAPQPDERQIHISLVAQLKLICRKDVLFYHCPNGELRDDALGAKLKAMGVLPGVYDLIFLYRERDQLQVLYLELKTRKGRLTEAQAVFGMRAGEVGCHVYAAHSLDEAIAILNKHKLLRVRR